MVAIVKSGALSGLVIVLDGYILKVQVICGHVNELPKLQTFTN